MKLNIVLFIQFLENNFIFYLESFCKFENKYF
jgi:hypothetical protein